MILRFQLMATGVVLAALAAGLVQGQVLAHGGASVAIEPPAAAAGASITIKIEGYEPETPVSVTLEGVESSSTLGTIATDASGAGSLAASLPADLKPGAYSVTAVGGDDNETTDLSVTASSSAPGQPGSPDRTLGDGGLTYKQPTAQWVGIAVAAAIVGLAGFALVLKKE